MFRSFTLWSLLLLLSCVWLCDPMDCSQPGSSVHGIFHARILEWVAISSSRGCSWPRDETSVSGLPCIGRQLLFTTEPTRKPTLVPRNPQNYLLGYVLWQTWWSPYLLSIKSRTQWNWLLQIKQSIITHKWCNTGECIIGFQKMRDESPFNQGYRREMGIYCN